MLYYIKILMSDTILRKNSVYNYNIFLVKNIYKL
jgi:hypothetical protein